MGFSSEMAIEQANRNEAKEAIVILQEIKEYLEKNKLLAIAEWDFDEQAPKVEKAIALIKKFSDKHQPDPQRFKQ